jgi:hypothetical protein
VNQPEHPATIHRRALALVHQYRSGDNDARRNILTEVFTGGPDTIAATVVSLVQLVDRVLDEQPANPDQWLTETLLHLASVEGDNPPANGGID